MPAVSVIIVNYNSGTERLGRCLAALDTQSFQDFEIILLDNASEDGSMQGLTETDRLKLIWSETNLGFAAGVNRAAEAASGTWLALLNPDTIAEPGWLAALAAATERYPDAAAFGSIQINADDPALLDGLGDVYHLSGIAYRGDYARPVTRMPEDDREIFAPCAAACLYRRDIFEALGGMAEDFFCYHEDVDFGMRLRLAGHRAILVRKAVIRHEGSGVTGRYSDFTVFHGTRNRIRTFVRTVPSPLFWLLFPVHLAANLLFFLRAVTLGIGGPYWKGMWHGFFKSPGAWQQRKGIQEKVKISAGEFIRMTTKSPFKLLLRQSDLRPVNLPSDSG